MKPTRTRRVLLLLALLPACGGRQGPPPHYVQAQPIKDDPAVVIAMPSPVPMSTPPAPKHSAVPLPVAVRHGGTKRPPRASDVIREANRKATEGPNASEYANAIMTYDYTPGALFQIYTAPDHLTDIQLQPGERIVGKPATGDSIRWVLGGGVSSAAGKEQQHVYVKPTRPDLHTTLAVNTDRRSYLLELGSYEDAYMAGVAWRYPQDELAQLEATTEQQQALAANTTAAGISIDRLNFHYGVAVKSGRPEWVPEQVFDDTHKTFIRFPVAMLDREAPALFVVSSAGETQMVNYRVKNDTYIVDRLFEVAELRLGQQSQEIVQIVRTR